MKNNWLEKYNHRKEKALLPKFTAIGDQLNYIRKKFKIKKLETCDSERWAYYEKTYGYHEDSVTGMVFRVDYDTGDIERIKDD